MAIFHVEKNTDYTIMANYHLRDKFLSLKAKGLYRKCCHYRKNGTTPCKDWPTSTGNRSTPSVRPSMSWNGPDYRADEGTRQLGAAAGSGVHHLRRIAVSI